MAIQSVGGGETTKLEGAAISTPGGSTVPPSGSATAAGDNTGEGKPFYVAADGTEFATPEDLTKAWDERNKPAGDDTLAAGSGNDTITAAGDDTLKGGQGNDTLQSGKSDDEIKANLKKAGGIYADEKYEPFALEFEKTGALSEESVKKAAEAFGIPEDFVKQFIEGEKAKRTNATSTQPTEAQIKMAQAIVEVVPEEADYRALLTWGKEGLSTEERASYDAALDRGDGITAKALLKDFHGRYLASGEAQGPRDVTREGLGDGNSQEGGPQGFASSAEMQAAMADPKYSKDPAYRRQVELRVHASKF